MKTWEEWTVPVLISRAYMRGPWYLPNFGPAHQKAGKPKRDPAVRGCTCIFILFQAQRTLNSFLGTIPGTIDRYDPVLCP